MNWQLITPQQANELKELGITEPSATSQYNLSELAVMLGYSFVPSNVKEAADKLIDELKTGASTAKDCNARLREANQQF